MPFGPDVGRMLVAGGIFVTAFAGCGQTEGEASNSNLAPTVTLGAPQNEAALDTKEPDNLSTPSSDSPATPESVEVDQPPEKKSSAVVDRSNSNSKDTANTTPVEETRTFKVEGPEQAIRISFDDVDLLKVLNLDPVPADAPERLPKWLKAFDGKRIRVRGFMFPPFQDTDIRGFVLARDNQICCFGRTPKEYDLIDIFMRKGVTTHYIQNRPFDVVGIFRIKTEIEKYTAMYEMEDAVVIEK